MASLFDSDEIYVGRDVYPHEVLLTPELVRKYIDGTGDDNPWYTLGSPLGPPIAPALITHSEAFRDKSWYLPNIHGNLQTRQEWEGFAAAALGSTLLVRCLIVDRYSKRDREYVVNETASRDVEGRMVTRSRSHQSFLMEQSSGPPIVIDKSREGAPGRDFADFGRRAGETFSAAPRRVTQTMCMAFSGPDLNYHTDKDKALELGFPEIVVQGMLSVCMIGEMMTRRFGLGFYYGGRLDLKLVNVLWANETTAAGGVIAERRREGRHTRALCEVWSEKSTGTRTIIGTASALELD